jgi:hypothetical protein
MKNLIIFCISFPVTFFSQDIIFKKDAEEIQAKVIEIGVNDIKYKKFSNPNGPTYVVSKNDLFLIKYENGEKDVFNKNSNSSNQNNNYNSTLDFCTKATNDALIHYKGDKSGAGWVCATTILVSPFIGLIPAAICSYHEPENFNLKAPNRELFNNSSYNGCYKEQAHKTKKRKIWKNFGIGSAVWLVIIAVANG